MDVGVDDDEEGAGEEVKKERGNEAMAGRTGELKGYNAARGERRRRLWRASIMAREVWCGRDLNRSEIGWPDIFGGRRPPASGDLIQI